MLGIQWTVYSQCSPNDLVFYSKREYSLSGYLKYSQNMQGNYWIKRVNNRTELLPTYIQGPRLTVSPSMLGLQVIISNLLV